MASFDIGRVKTLATCGVFEKEGRQLEGERRERHKSEMEGEWEGRMDGGRRGEGGSKERREGRRGWLISLVFISFSICRPLP